MIIMWPIGRVSPMRAARLKRAPFFGPGPAYDIIRRPIRNECPPAEAAFMRLFLPGGAGPRGILKIDPAG